MAPRHWRMAPDALGTVVVRPLGAARLHVGVMACDARQPFAGRLPAPAQRQGLHVTDGRERSGRRIVAHEDRQVVGKRLAGRVLVLGAPLSRNPRFSLEMALIAHAVAPGSSQLGGVDHRPEPLDVVASRTVTSLASHTRLQERFAGESVDGALERPLDAAGVAEQARRIHGVVQLHLAQLCVPRGHVPSVLHRIVIDGRLIQETVDLEQERPAARVRAHVVLQPLRAVERTWPRPPVI